MSNLTTLKFKTTNFLGSHFIKDYAAVLDTINMTPRPMTIIAKRHFAGRQDLVGVEVGTHRGENAQSILQELPMRRLFLVDPYLPYDVMPSGRNSDFKIAEDRLRGFRQVTWMIESSEAASKSFTPESLDFVYVDGNHSHKFVKQDLHLYYPLIKRGGLLGGHDYVPSLHFLNYHMCGNVKRAVDEFAQEQGLTLHAVFPDWYFVVGE